MKNLSKQTNWLLVKTPSYCYLKYAMDRIYNYDKNMKLIILLREPISRAYSHFNMGKQWNRKFFNINTDDEIFKFFDKQKNEN